LVLGFYFDEPERNYRTRTTSRNWDDESHESGAINSLLTSLGIFHHRISSDTLLSWRPPCCMPPDTTAATVNLRRVRNAVRKFQMFKMIGFLCVSRWCKLSTITVPCALARRIPDLLAVTLATGLLVQPVRRFETTWWNDSRDIALTW